MDDKLRLERNSLKSALDATHASELAKAVETAKKEADRDTKIHELRLKEENEKLQTQMKSLQKDIDALNKKLVDSVNDAIKEGDKKVSKNKK